MKNVCKNDHFNTETLQSAANPGTMELVTQNNAVKSPISDLKQPESKACVYTVEEVAQMDEPLYSQTQSSAAGSIWKISIWTVFSLGIYP